MAVHDVGEWLSEMILYLNKTWGLDESFSDRISRFYLYLHQYGLNPQITSGYRSKEKQQSLTNRYFSGDRSVIVKPAANSLHSRNNWLGNPAALAVDISTSNPELAARIATALGIGAGYYWKTPDRVHFYDERG
jgi:hypothetical protein